MNILKQIVASILLFPQLFFLKIKLKPLGIGNDDLVFGLTNCTFLESMVVSNFHPYRKIAISYYEDYGDWFKKPRGKNFGTNISIEISQLVRRMFRMPESIFIYNKKIKKLGDGDYYIGTKQKLNKIFDDLILIVGGHKNINNGLLDKNVYLVKYPQLLKKDFAKNIGKKTIVFLGQDFVRNALNINLNTYVHETNKYLSYLRKLYDGKYELIYKPHPRETTDSQYLNLEKFRNINDKRPAEIFYIENKSNIKAIYAIGSTASLSAYNLGIDSYVFVKLFPFDKIRSSVYGQYFSGLPRECFITDLTLPPPRIRKHDSDANSFEESLKTILNADFV